MQISPFNGAFTQQEAIADEAIEAAVLVLKSGRLHRYNTLGGEVSEVSLLEREYAACQGSRFCLACASGGYAMQTALRAAGLAHGDTVLTNAFTLSPVPGAIAGAGGRPVLVECTPDLTIDLDDLEAKAAGGDAKMLLLSLMRGHLPDMDRLKDICETLGLILIEDCAHTMGASWRGGKSGNFGLAGCFSTQTYKHVNSGEGGLLTSNDENFMARAIILSGSYMFYERHGAAPGPEVFERIRLEMPNCSGRMDNLRAAILRPQLRDLDDRINRWNERYRTIEARLRSSRTLHLPTRPPEERYVGSSIQFRIPGIGVDGANAYMNANKKLGVELKWFGDDNPVGFTSNHASWRYMDRQSLPGTDEILSGLFDLRIPLTFSLADCEQIAGIVLHCAAAIDGAKAA